MARFYTAAPADPGRIDMADPGRIDMAEHRAPFAV